MLRVGCFRIANADRRRTIHGVHPRDPPFSSIPVLPIPIARQTPLFGAINSTCTVRAFTGHLEITCKLSAIHRESISSVEITFYKPTSQDSYAPWHLPLADYPGLRRPSLCFGRLLRLAINTLLMYY
jgi:hypothetical protein